MQPSQPNSSGTSRREFIKQLAAITAVAAAGLPTSETEAQTRPAGAPATSPAAAAATIPWYRRAVRWGQTNITEADVTNYDIPFWRNHWQRTAVQGLVINAGGIVAYYPSKFPLQYQPPNLNGRDLFGELTRAAHEDGIVVLARMDSSKAHEPLYRAHPDWFAVDAGGQPYRSGEFYIPCISGPYYSQYLPDIFREIIDRSHPEGFTDNGWSGPGRDSICYCANCARLFGQYSSGKSIPGRRDWNDAVYRQWIEWSYARRIEQWEFNGRITHEAGGPDCIWVGMNGASVTEQSGEFRDMKEICTRAEMIMLDNQFRSDAAGFQENALSGKMLHGLLGWDKVMPESMSMFQMSRSQFRLSAKSPPEARMWMLAGFAGGIQPWWHHVGAFSDDRRSYTTAEPVMQWHKANEQYLLNRRPVATVAVGWSQRNMDFFGRDSAEALVDQPWRGFTQALIRARIPYLPVHLDHLDRDAANFSVLILPNIGTLTDEQIASIRKFVAAGGSLVATGQTSLYDKWGDARSDFALADFFGVKGGKPATAQAGRGGRGGGGGGGAGGSGGTPLHTYLRLTPEIAARAYGPRHADAPPADGQRHPVLAGFDATDILPFGSSLTALTVNSGAQVLATYIPPFPTSPPETVWMRTPRTDIPAIIVNETPNNRIVFMPADLDRRFAADNFPDHGNLLANAVRWAARDNIPLTVTGAGLINCELYQQPGRLILHVLNVTSAATWRAPIDELIAVGPLAVKVRPPAGMAVSSVKTQVAGAASRVDFAAESGWVAFELKSVLDHELVVIEG